MEGFWVIATTIPSRCHSQLVIVLVEVELSKNCMIEGTQPTVVSAVKRALVCALVINAMEQQIKKIGMRNASSMRWLFCNNKEELESLRA